MFSTVVGSGAPTLLFIHGLSCDHSDWVEQIEVFEPRHRCISVDLPGHGASPSNGEPLTIERCINETHESVAPLMTQSDTPVVVFGHSMGCRVAMGVAGRLGDAAAAVVLIDGSHFGDGDPQLIRQRVLANVAATGFERTMRNTFEPMFNEASPSDLRERAMARALAMDPQLTPGLLADMAAWDAAHIETTVRSLTVPLLAIQSTSVDTQRRRVILEPGQDSDFTKCLREWAPTVQVELLPGVGHFTMNEAPAQVNRLIAAFVEQRVTKA